jgi:hypothetical protein
MHVALHASYAALHNLKFRIFAKTQPSQKLSKFRRNADLATPKSAQMPNYFPPLHTPNNPLSIMLPT